MRARAQPWGRPRRAQAKPSTRECHCRTPTCSARGNDPINTTDPSGFFGVAAGYPAGGVATGSGWGALQGVGFSATNVVTSLLMPNPFAGSGAQSQAVTIGAHAAATGGGGVGGPNGVGANDGVVGLPVPQGAGGSTFLKRPPGLCDWSGACLAMNLPKDPSGLSQDWSQDTAHLDPNGTRWRHPSGDYLDFHKAQP